MVKVFSNGAIRLRPAMLFCSVEQGALCFSYVGRVTSWACVSVDHAGRAQERDSILVGRVEGHFGCLKADVKLHLPTIFE